MKLYEINYNVGVLANKIAEAQADELGFLDFGELKEEFKKLEIERESAILDVAREIKNLKMFETGIAEEVKKLTERKRVLSNKIDRLKSFLLTAVAEGEKFKDANSSISWRKSQGVTILQESAIPEVYMRIKKEPDKTSMLRDLKGGASIPGVELEENQSIQIK